MRKRILANRDVIEQPSEQALRQNEEFTRAILDSLPEHVAVLDEKGIILVVNKAWLTFAKENGPVNIRQIGPGADYLGVCRKAADLDDPLAAEALAGIEAVLAGLRMQFDIEYPCHSPTQQRWFQMNVARPDGEHKGAIIRHLDFTESKKSEEALKESQQRLTIAQQAGGIGVFDLNLRNNQTVWTAESEKIYGLPAGSFTGTNDKWAQSVHPDDLQRIIDEACRSVRQKADGQTEFRIIRPNGEVRWIADFWRIICDEHGQPFRMVGVNIDITERKSAEKELKQYADRLAEANRTKELFNDILTHDLLNPATAIKAAAELLLEKVTDSRSEKLLRSIVTSTLNLTKVIELAAEYIKTEVPSERLKFELLDLDQILRHVLLDFDLQLKNKGMAVVYASTDEHLTALNPMIKDVFVNLLSNAIKYSPSHSTVEIKVADEKASWIVSIKDHGKGIADRDKKRIFHRLERVSKEGAKGFGLGLAIAKRVVEMHCGDIWVEDNPEGGSIFFVRLPKLHPTHDCRTTPHKAA